MLDQTQAIEIAVPFLKELEGFSEVAYSDAGGFSYGYGHHGCHPMARILEPAASALLFEDATEVCTLIAPRLECAYLNTNQLAALISFTYNVGPGKMGEKDGFLVLKSGTPSTLLKMIRETPRPDRDQLNEIGNQFLHWIYVEGQPNSGLCTRRTRERELYLKPFIPNPEVAETDSPASGDNSMKGK